MVFNIGGNDLVFEHIYVCMYALLFILAVMFLHSIMFPSFAFLFFNSGPLFLHLLHPSPPATPPSMILLQDYIPQLADKWAELGTALGLEHQVLALQSSSQPPDRCMHSLLSAWLDAGDRVVAGARVEVSWTFLVRVLRSSAVDKGSVANTIQARHM